MSIVNWNPIALCALLLAAPAPGQVEDAASRAAPVVLGYRLAPGMTWSMQADQRMAGQVRIDSASPEPWDVTASIVVDGRCVDEGDGVLLLHRVRQVVMRGRMGREEVDLTLSGAELAGNGEEAEQRLRLTPQGPRALDPPLDGPLGVVFSGVARAWPMLSAEPVVVGATWSRPPDEDPWVGSERRAAYWLEQLDAMASTARIDFHTTTTQAWAMPDPPPEDVTVAGRVLPPTVVRMEEDARGSVWFDVDQGRPLRARRQGTLQLRTAQYIPFGADGGHRQQVDQSLEVSVELQWDWTPAGQ